MNESTITFRVDDSLKTAFAEAAKLNDRTGAQLLRDFMRDYVKRQQNAADYETWFRNKVEAGQKAFGEGRYITQEEATARAEKRKAALSRRIDNMAGIAE
ncbi:hypothetical protein LJC36_02435 [Desulfovibrio sp. OttesenSCG-928-C14]|nr:hypothetical protein [Desulfovibrio sp. OttesenSCG-928-C14]